jgi:hypothetical protein
LNVIHALLAAGAWQQPAEPPVPAARRWTAAVRDAHDRRGLADVRVELWTEDLYGPPRLVASAQTGPDGVFDLVDPSRAGEKLVLRKPGYGAHESGSSEEEFLLFATGGQRRWRVVDLQGAAIERARLQTRQSCRHAVSAAAASGGPDGSVELAGGPGLFQNGDLEVLADGFGALGKLDLGDAAGLAALVLPHRRGHVLVMLDEQGRPLESGSVRYQSESGGFPLAPDAAGAVRIDTLFDGPNGQLFWRRPDGREAVRELGELPLGRQWIVRFGPPADAACTSALEVVCTGDPALAQRAQVRLLHEQGWVWRGAGKQLVVPGVVHLVAGAPFSGVRERGLRLELAPGASARAEIELEPEPSLRVRLPADTLLLHVQAGPDSLSLPPPEDGARELQLTVPPDRQVTLGTLGRGVHRLELAPWSDELAVSLDRPATLVDLLSAPVAPVRVDLQFQVRTSSLPSGERPPVAAELRCAGQRLQDLDPAPERVHFQVPRGERWEARFSAESHGTLYRAGLAEEKRLESLELPLQP